MKILTDENVNLASLKNDTVAIVGYGSQGRAHARNLHESGFDVLVGARESGPSWKKAKDDGLKVTSLSEAAKKGRLVALLTPDMAQEKVFEEEVKNNLKEGDTLLFAHGFTVHYGRIKPAKNIDVVLVAPKGPGDLVRREFERGRGVPCLRAVHQDFTGKAADKALAYAHGLGGTRAGVIDTTFPEETETDLFGEQAVLCGGATELVQKGFETLVEAGYQPEVAYFECLHELKLIVDLLYEGGMGRMHEFISETAKYGDLVSGPRVINDETKQRMKEVLRDIQQGKFAHDWILENQAGKPRYNKLMQDDMNHPIEKVGAELRSRMSWLKEKSNSKE
jgi:ketol-acid reductoisomerase